MKEKKNFDFPTIRVVYIVVSFGLAVFDMFMLQEKLLDILPNGTTPSFAAITSVIVATMANFIAFTWGQENGKMMAAKVINKKTAGTFATWVTIGCVYALIRLSYIIKHAMMGYKPILDLSGIMGQIAEIILLSISYIGTGILIEESARDIFDADCVACRKAKKKFDRIHADIAAEVSDLQANIGVLKKYGNNYKTLERQKNKIETAIRRAERGAMADIVGKMLTKHKEISPTLANAVMDEVIQDNKRDNESEII